MSKQLCIVCGGRRPNETLGVRVTKLTGHAMLTLGFVHDGKCLIRSKPLHKHKQLTKDEVNAQYGKVAIY